ncbi:hypothetical protein OROHE_003716 [Orobanche hederae]
MLIYLQSWIKSIIRNLKYSGANRSHKLNYWLGNVCKSFSKAFLCFCYHTHSPMQLTLGFEPNISHLRTFGCAVQVPIPPPQRIKMGPQCRLGIYVGFDSPSIIRYLEPVTGDLFTARFAECHFDETVFPSIGADKTVLYKDKQKPVEDVSWNVQSLSHLDPRTTECENKVKRIIHLQNIANRLPDAFNDASKVTKSSIPAANTPARIVVPNEHTKMDDDVPRQKCGRPIGSKDTVPRKRKGRSNVVTNQDYPSEHDADESVEHNTANNEGIMNSENTENLINHYNEIWDRKSMIIDDLFVFSIAREIMNDDYDNEPYSITEFRQMSDWPKWEEAIKSELASLEKRMVFGQITRTPNNIKPIGYKWVFVRKRNEKNEIARNKARLVAQGFSQWSKIDYDETYSPVMDIITFRFLISMAVHERLDMRLMDVVTAYLYGSLDSNIYIKIPDGYKMLKSATPREIYSIKLQKSLYWIRAIRSHSNTGFAIIAVYVDDINLIGTPKELTDAAEYVKKEFEVKDLGITKLCLILEIKHKYNEILVHQSAYTKRLLKRFNMDKAHPLSTPMVVRNLDLMKDPFRPKESSEGFLGPEVPYLNAIGALMYLEQCTTPDISFAVNLLARYSSEPTRRHWNGIKHIFCYLSGTIVLGLSYLKEATNSGLVGYADAGYKSDPHKARSQNGYLFCYNGTTISWRSTKQILIATSSNHSKIIALYEAGRESVWLRSIIAHIQNECRLKLVTYTPTIIYEDNAACISQVKGVYIKGDHTKHISPKFFYTHELQKSGEINVQQIRSCHNLADIFTKSQPTSIFEKLVYGIGMRRANTKQD